jgi:Peptidase family S41/N-terminal domain of Peptidase_S41 in eukaryotic IRBP
MKKSASIVCAVVLALAGVFVAGISSAQGPPATLDEAARRSAVEAAARLLEERYVFPDVGGRAAQAIESALRAGAYDGIDQPSAFAQRLTEDLQGIAKDKHLRVSALGAGPPVGPDGQPPRPPPRADGGVTRVDMLADRVGYIEIVGFPPEVVAKEPVDRAMSALKDARALIVDIRRNGGGAPDSVTHLVSYFVKGNAPVHVNTFINRNPGTETFNSQEFWSDAVPVSFAGKPVYVLTSGFTFSGGEEFAYDMQVLDLGEIVGETTGGGANPGGMMPLAAGLAIFVPAGRAENPLTKTNWEGVGVKPDIAVPSADALEVALERLGVSPAGADVDALSVASLFTPRTTAQPGTEAAVRRMSEENARGEPDYDLLVPPLADATRNQLPRLKEMFSSLGAIESVEFVEVGPGGGDVYEVHYANGALRWMIALTPDGKTAMAAVQPLPPQP